LACLFEDPKRDFIGETLAVGAQIVAPFYEWVTPDFIEQVHRRGLRLIPWTVNDSSWWQKLTSWGIDGIITDYPRKLLEQLKGR
jgi:glycerophosphoryl diester phosphodiesterase